MRGPQAVDSSLLQTFAGFAIAGLAPGEGWGQKLGAGQQQGAACAQEGTQGAVLGVQDVCRGLCAVADAACGNLPAGDWAPRASQCRMVLGQLGWNQLRSLPSPCSLPLGGFVASEVSQPAWHGAASSAHARVSQHTLEQSPTPCMLQLPRGSPAQEVPGGLEQLLLLLCTLS